MDAMPERHRASRASALCWLRIETARDQPSWRRSWLRRFCVDVPCLRRNFPPLLFHDLGVLVCRAIERSKRPSAGKVRVSYTTTADVIGRRRLTLRHKKRAADCSAAFLRTTSSSNFPSSGRSQFPRSRRGRGSRYRHVPHSRGDRYSDGAERIRMNRPGHE